MGFKRERGKAGQRQVGGDTPMQKRRFDVKFPYSSDEAIEAYENEGATLTRTRASASRRRRIAVGRFAACSSKADLARAELRGEFACL